MHAILIVTKMDPTKYDQQRRELEERIVPFVKDLPGFVSGTWMYDRAQARASSMVVVDSAETATKLTEMVRQDVSSPRAGEAGVQLETIVVGEVQAQARR